jgi:hypothetical protein
MGVLGKTAIPPTVPGENPTQPGVDNAAAKAVPPGGPPAPGTPPAPGGAAPGGHDPLAGLTDEQKIAVAQKLAEMKTMYEQKLKEMGAGGAPPAPPAPAAPAAAAPAMPTEPTDKGDGENPFGKGAGMIDIHKQIEIEKGKRIELEKQLAVEKDARLSREYIEKAGTKDYAGLPGSRASVAKALRAIDTHVPVDVAKDLHTLLKAAAARAAIGADVLAKTLGVGALGTDTEGGSPWDKIIAKAKGIVEKSGDKLSQEQAIEKVMATDEGKALYAEYKDDQQAQIHGR